MAGNSNDLIYTSLVRPPLIPPYSPLSQPDALSTVLNIIAVQYRDERELELMQLKRDRQIAEGQHLVREVELAEAKQQRETQKQREITRNRYEWARHENELRQKREREAEDRRQQRAADRRSSKDPQDGEDICPLDDDNLNRFLNPQTSRDYPRDYVYSERDFSAPSCRAGQEAK
ncbi:hypothetical protein B0T26DRAFT_675993 [Lasiosphaeria miniovina]|uniref:Uncharacterized protein n=1 Tax=Lasiosphaeria miniovina TaxID=1954250 RepID=A0AA40AKX5_9PEZI|nr:uncharacterized protein B0T26DRAFT_675993 [Lasiosphaeria miniovina]KAK0717719.1 hypothetical protein B0T26DRAFT_675993 [Lasiosphaeria miniovina]